MRHINIITCSEFRELPEWDRKLYPVEEYDFQFNSKEDIVWDGVLIRQNLPYPMHMKCRKGNVVYTNCEPPSSRPLPKSFIKQFDYGLIQNVRIKGNNMKQFHGYESWTMGRSFKTGKNRFFYEDLRHLEPSKTKTVSIITSNKVSQPGHIKRVDIINRLLKDFPGQIDMFGKGYNFIDTKADALLSYRFHICIENAFIPNCWTEKLADPILAQSVPIYAGCTNIKDYFGEEGYISFNIEDYDSLKKIVERILKNPEEEYAHYKPGLERLRTILMEKENIVPFIVDYIENNKTTEISTYDFKPMEKCGGFKFQYYYLRFKRLLFKVYFYLFKRHK